MEDERNNRGQAFAGFPQRAPILDALREIVRLSGEFERHLGRVLAVNPTDLTAMEHLIESGPLTPSELARRLQVSTAAATLVVDRLERSGHARRERHVDDRRKVVVVPAPASAARAAGELLPLVRGVAEIVAELPADESGAVERFLAQVVGIYRDVVEDGASAS